MLLEGVFELRVELIKFALEQHKLLQDSIGLFFNFLVEFLQAIEHLEGDILFQYLTIKANSEILEISESIFDLWGGFLERLLDLVNWWDKIVVVFQT